MFLDIACAQVRNSRRLSRSSILCNRVFAAVDSIRTVADFCKVKSFVFMEIIADTDQKPRIVNGLEEGAERDS